jgi:hypothetical protein
VDFLEEAGQDLDNGDKDQVMKRSRVGDNNPHLTSKAQAPQGGAFTLEIFHGVIQPNFMSLQEPVESVASLKPKKLPQLCRRQPASLVFFQSKCFQGAAREIAPRSGQALRNIVGDVKGDFHG